MVLAGFIIAQMVIAAEKVRGMSAAMAFQTPSNGSSPVAYTHFYFML